MTPVFPMLLLVALLTPSVSAKGEEAAALLRRVIDFQPERHEREREYAFRQRTTTRELAKDGSVRTAKSETYLITPGAGGEYRRLVAKNGKPLSPKEESREERKFREFLDEQIRLPEADRTARTKEKVKSRVERYQSRLEEALEVFDFERRPDLSSDGVTLRVFDFVPKPGYEGHSRSTKILARMEGTVWVDPERDQLARLQVRFREDLSFLGGIFGRVSRGSQARAEATLIDGLWLLDRIEVMLNARFYFLKRYHQNIVVDYDDYRKFRVETEERLIEPTSPLP